MRVRVTKPDPDLRIVAGIDLDDRVVHYELRITGFGTVIVPADKFERAKLRAIDKARNNA